MTHLHPCAHACLASYWLLVAWHAEPFSVDLSAPGPNGLARAAATRWEKGGAAGVRAAWQTPLASLFPAAAPAGPAADEAGEEGGEGEAGAEAAVLRIGDEASHGL